MKIKNDYDKGIQILTQHSIVCLFFFFSSVQNDINLLSDLNGHRKVCIMRGHMNSDGRVSLYKCAKVHLAYTDKCSVYR